VTSNKNKTKAVKVKASFILELDIQIYLISAHQHLLDKQVYCTTLCICRIYSLSPLAKT